ncbi:MAG: glycoside hydrolase family 3 C-terminal domain-containing protein [Clostridia bacterium]|nr:glycoside hydrolase family 3 C-terminal domain-containing protein [Clostridia bacterium]
MLPVYKDASQPVELRVKDLLSKMTLEEKVAQMRLLCLHGTDAYKTADGKLNFDYFKEHTDACGAIFNIIGLTLKELNEIRSWYIENTRLGIPPSIHSEGLHGAIHRNGTTFPSSVAMAASFDRDLYRKAVGTIGDQLNGLGVDTVYAPNLDVSRDPRWGRVEEHYGEDPYLIAEFGAAYVEEVQKRGISSCIKHFAVHSAPDSGINLAPVHEGRREIESIYLYPFRQVIERAKPEALMPAYSEEDGEPLHTSKRWMRRILRDQLGFEGFTVSDYGALWMVLDMHFAARDVKEVGIRALEAGVDMEAPDQFAYAKCLEEAVKNGEVDEALVDEAVSRLLKHKFESGIFDRPYDESKQLTAQTAEDAASIARQVAENSVVLLKNENKILPLSEKIGKIAVIGPNADRVSVGGYSGTIHRFYQNSLRRALARRIGSENVLYAEGCGHTKQDPTDLASAVAVAEQADVAVLVLGDWNAGFGGVGGDIKDLNHPGTCGEGFDVSSLDLPGDQQQLLEAVYQTGTPVILIMESGRPYAIKWAKEHVSAILQAWYPGEEGGNALCRLLFGDVNPSAKLPISFPQSVGHLPCYYNHKHSAKGFYKKPGTPTEPGRDYVFSSPDSLFTFGDGLSYTEFEYSNLTVFPDPTDELPVKVTVTVRNIGERFGGEPVLLFVSDVRSTIAPYVKQLKAFDKVFLQPNESKTVSFTLGFDAFSQINEDYIPEAEAGEFILQVGSQKASFMLKKSIQKPDRALSF